jgi:hypothetical protein
MCCWRSRQSRLLLRLGGQAAHVIERTVNPLPQFFPISRQRVGEDHSGIRLAPRHWFEYGRSVQAQEARTILLGETKQHAFLVQTHEEIALTKQHGQPNIFFCCTRGSLGASSLKRFTSSADDFVQSMHPPQNQRVMITFCSV